MACKSVLCEPCLYVDTKVEAEGFCSTCAEYLCSNCITDHRKVKLTRNHVVDRHCLPENGAAIKEMNEMLICPVHREMKISHKCLDHMTCMCYVCRIDTHRDCEHVLEITNEDGELEGVQESLAELKISADSLKERKKENRKNLYQSRSQILSEQEVIIEKAINDLEKFKVQLAMETNEKLNVAVSELDQDIEFVEAVGQISAKYIEIIEAAKKYGDIACQKVIRHLLSDDILKQTDIVKAIKKKKDYELLFVKNTENFTLLSLGTVNLEQHQRSENRKFHELGIEKTSDELIDNIEMGRAQTAETFVTKSQTVSTTANSSQIESTVLSLSKTENTSLSTSLTQNITQSSSETETTFMSSSVTDNSITRSSQKENTGECSSQTANTTLSSMKTEKQTINDSQPEKPVKSFPRPEKPSIDSRQTESATGKIEEHSLPTIFESFVCENREVCIRGSLDTKQCSIYGISVLSDGHLVVIDYENSNIKLLTYDYALLDVLRLPGRPVRICSVRPHVSQITFVTSFYEFVTNVITFVTNDFCDECD